MDTEDNIENEDEVRARGAATIFRFGLFAALAGIVVLASSSFMVNENEHALVLRFGKPVRPITEAGWHFRFPAPIEKVHRLDARLQHGDIRLSEALTRDKRNLILPIFFSWKVSDPLKFLNNVETVDGASTKLDTLITSARNSVLGQHDFSDLVSTDQSAEPLAKLEARILEMTKEEAREHYGVELVNVGLTQIKLPQSNTESVFKRMRAERKREAAVYRAEGKAKDAELKAAANQKSQALLAEARRYAEETRGKAEAEAAAIYAQAHSKDVQFYEFMRSLQSLRTVVDKNTTLVLDTSTPPFSLLQMGDAKFAPHLAGKVKQKSEQQPTKSWLFPPEKSLGVDLPQQPQTASE